MGNNNTLIIEKIKQCLKAKTIRQFFLPEEYGDIPLADAAVLIPLFFNGDELSVIFTERSEHVPTHKGQISFPGGSVDETDDSLASAAIRETYEEVGILPQDIEILGQLSSYPTPAGFRIYPFAGYVKKISENISHCEVSRVITIPLHHLMDDKNMEIKNFSKGKNNYPMPFFYYEQNTIWGATGLILKEFLDEVKNFI